MGVVHSKKKRFRFSVPKTRLLNFCRQWRVKKMALFGSVLRHDFGKKSDVDILVRFDPRANKSLLDHIGMEKELSAIFRRKVDLVTQRALEQSHNLIRKNEILRTARVIYES